MKSTSHTLRQVGILRGGIGGERSLSHDTGRFFLNALSDHLRTLDIFVDKDGSWYIDGRKRSPDKILTRVDAVINALHGAHGESGSIQQLLEQHARPYTGSNRFGAALSYNKIGSKNVFKKEGIKTPQWRVFRKEDPNLHKKARDLFRSFPFPAAVKPAQGGAGEGVRKVERFNDLFAALTHAFDHANAVIIEEYIDGQEVSSGVLEGFRGKKHYVLPPIEVKKGDIHRYKHHAQDGYTPFSHRETATRSQIEEITQKAHDALGLRHISRADLIISKKRGVYLLEVNALPHLGENSPYSFALSHAGIKPHVFSTHLLSLAEK